MKEEPGALRRYAARIVAVVLVAALYGFARLPTLPDGERKEMASRFAFAKLMLPTVSEDLSRRVRPVHPQMERISAWISSVGGGVALNDFDGDGLHNDVCLVETRVDRVVVSPAPGTGSRFDLFTLDPDPELPHDRATTAPMGCLPGDWNEDGRTDALVYYWGRPPVLFLQRASGDGAPLSARSFRAQALAPAEEIWNTNALTTADVDGDGHLDLIVGNYFPDGMELLNPAATTPAHMHRSMSRSENGGQNRLYLWEGATSGAEPEVRFRDIPDAFDRATTYAWPLAVGAADLDGDLLPEIYFANDFGNDRLLHNLSTPGKPRFRVLSGVKGLTTPASKVLGHDSFKGMGIDFVDYNRDGHLDLYVSNIAQNWALEESHFVWTATGRPERMKDGVAPYVDKSEDLGMARSGWGWDARFADFDNDGEVEALQAVGFVRGDKNRWPELHEIAMGNDNNLLHLGAWHHLQPGDDLSGRLHNPFFVRASSGRYFDLAPDVGLGDNQISRGLAIADVDGDGDLDFAVGNQWEDSYFYRNDNPGRNAGLVLDLLLPAAEGRTRPAVGARVVVELSGGHRVVAQVDGGSGHSGKRAPSLHFGLGRNAGQRVTVEVRYRDGSGRPREARLTLTPGRHRVVLGEVGNHG